MNPILQAALGSIVRWGLALAAGYLVKSGIWTGSDAETYIAAGTMAVLTIGWSLWNKYRERLKLLTALSMPRGVTEHDVQAHIASGGATPPVSTPKDEVPLMAPLPPAKPIDQMYPPDAA